MKAFKNSFTKELKVKCLSMEYNINPGGLQGVHLFLFGLPSLKSIKIVDILMMYKILEENPSMNQTNFFDRVEAFFCESCRVFEKIMRK